MIKKLIKSLFRKKTNRKKIIKKYKKLFGELPPDIDRYYPMDEIKLSLKERIVDIDFESLYPGTMPFKSTLKQRSKFKLNNIFRRFKKNRNILPVIPSDFDGDVLCVLHYTKKKTIIEKIKTKGCLKNE